MYSQPSFFYVFPFIGAAINMIVGFLWYSPLLFGKKWAKLTGMDKVSPEEMKKGIGKIYGMMFLAAILSSHILMLFMTRLNPRGLVNASVIYGVLIWMGFVTTVQFGNWLFSKKPFQLFLIDTGYQFVCYLILSGVAALFIQMMR